MQIQNHSSLLLLDGPMGVGSGQNPKMTVIGDRTYILDYAAIIALDKTGKLDTSFDGDGLAYVSPDGIFPYAIYPNEEQLTVLGVARNSYPNELHKSVSFSASGRSDALVSISDLTQLNGLIVSEVTTDKNGYIYIAGWDEITRLNGNGSVSSSYSTAATSAIKPDSYIDNIVLDDLGRLYVTASREIPANYATNTPSSRVFDLIRLRTDGTLDTSFGHNGYVTFQDYDGTNSLAITATGDILVGMRGQDAAVALVTSQGVKDTSFGSNGIATINLNGTYGGEYVCDIVTDGDLAFAVIASYPNHKVNIVPITKTGLSSADSFLLTDESIAEGTDAVIDTTNKIIKLAVPTWESDGIEIFTVSYKDLLNHAPTGTVTFTGVATEGQTLTASNTLADVDGLGTISYLWMANGTEISGATGSTYTLTQAEVGKAISVRASYIDGFGTAESATSSSAIAGAMTDITTLIFKPRASVDDNPPALDFEIGLSSNFTNARQIQVLFWAVGHNQTWITLTRDSSQSTFSETVVLSKYAREGEYAIRSIRAIDDRGISLALSQQQLEERGFDVTSELFNPNADASEPLITSISVSEPVTDQNGRIHLSLEIKAEDDKSGLVSPFIVEFTSPTGKSLQQWASLDANGSANVDFVLNEYSASGVYTLNTIRVDDHAGNETYGGAYLASNPKSVTLTNPVADNAKPELTDFRLKAVFDSATNRPKILIEGAASDHASGVSGMYLRLWSPTGSSAHIDKWLSILPSKTEKNGIVTNDYMALPIDFLPGEYTVGYVKLEDRAGNHSELTRSAVEGHSFDGAVNVYFPVAPISGSTTSVTGSENHDYVFGTDTTNDNLNSGNGNDYLYGGQGNDSVNAGAGNDWIDGADFGGTDSYAGGDGSDTLSYVDVSTSVTVNLEQGTGTGTGIGIDSILGIENLVGGTASDLLTGDAKNNEISGGTGDDIINGGLGSDLLDGGSGNDTYYVDNLGDLVKEAAGQGVDKVIAIIDHVMAGHIENLVLGSGASKGTGNALSNVMQANDSGNELQGGGGNDHLKGGKGKDKLQGGSGDDLVDAGEGDDLIVGGDGAGNDAYLGGKGIDTVRYTSAITGITVDLTSGTASGNEIGNDTLSGIENIIGGQAGDTLTGDENDNQIDGFTGNDTIHGGGGVDTAVYTGTRVQYTFTLNKDGFYIVTDNISDRDGVDQLHDVEKLAFSDEVVTLANNIPVNNAPTGSVKINGTPTQGKVLSVSNTLKDFDGMGAITYTWSSRNDGVEWSNIGTGPSFTLKQNEVGKQVRVIAQYTDGQGNMESVVSSPTAKVANTNDAPTVVQPVSRQGATEGSSFSFVVPDNTFTDVDAGEVLTLSTTLANGKPLPKWLKFNPATGAFSGIPADADTGLLRIKLTATDKAKAKVSTSFDLGVEGVNMAPSAQVVAKAAIAVEGKAFNYVLPKGTFTDGDRGDVLTYSCDDLPSWLSINSLTGKLTGIPGYNAADQGPVVLSLVATDQSGMSTKTNLTLNITHTAKVTGGAGADNLTAGIGNDSLTGLAGNDTLAGGAGNDMLDGGVGADVLRGEQGNDTYVVDQAADSVLENGEDGIDTVQVKISTAKGTYTLTENVENGTLLNTVAFNLSGNGLANQLVGNKAANILNGGAGNDVLNGGVGKDILTGGIGADRFVFDAALSASNVDIIQDFETGIDRIVLSAKSLAKLKGLTSLSSYFVSKEGSKAVDTNDYLVFDTSTDTLYYDADGSGKGAAIAVCQIIGVVTAADIEVI